MVSKPLLERRHQGRRPLRCQDLETQEKAATRVVENKPFVPVRRVSLEYPSAMGGSSGLLHVRRNLLNVPRRSPERVSLDHRARKFTNLPESLESRPLDASNMRMNWVRLAVILTATALRGAEGQAGDTSKVWTAFKKPVIDTATIPRQGDVAIDQKSAASAGILSFLIPGLGSFYAGAYGHGAIHLSIGVVSFLLYGEAASSRSSEQSCTIIGARVAYCTPKRTSGTEAQLGATLGVYVINDAWSIFTAVRDAHAHNNEADGRIAGNFYIEPAARQLSRGTGLQLASWRF